MRTEVIGKVKCPIKFIDKLYVTIIGGLKGQDMIDLEVTEVSVGQIYLISHKINKLSDNGENSGL